MQAKIPFIITPKCENKKIEATARPDPPAGGVGHAQKMKGEKDESTKAEK